MEKSCKGVNFIQSIAGVRDQQVLMHYGAS